LTCVYTTNFYKIILRQFLPKMEFFARVNHTTHMQGSLYDEHVSCCEKATYITHDFHFFLIFSLSSSLHVYIFSLGFAVCLLSLKPYICAMLIFSLSSSLHIYVFSSFGSHVYPVFQLIIYMCYDFC